MKQNMPPDPVAVGRLGAEGIVFAPDGIPDLVEQPWGRSVHVDLLTLDGLTGVNLCLNKSAVDVSIKTLNYFISNGFLTYYRTVSPFGPNHWTGICGRNRSTRNDQASPKRVEC